jgi:hypothetical protein
VARDGSRFVGTNEVRNPPRRCPRGPGDDYRLCYEVCDQIGHAEDQAIEAAGRAARGGTLYLEGHDHACDSCKAIADWAGVTIVVGAPP